MSNNFDDSINQFNNLIQNSQNALLCGPDCQKKKYSENLEQIYLDAKNNVLTAPSQLNTAAKNYYTYTKGEAGYDEYITNELSTPNCIIFNSNDELLLQIYGYTLNSILGIYFINLSTTTSLKLYSVLDDTIPLPALNITQSSIAYLSTYEELVKNIDNKDYWIALKNLGYTYEFQLKDINTQIFIDGSGSLSFLYDGSSYILTVNNLHQLWLDVNP
jgi:hypothetical protein